MQGESGDMICYFCVTCMWYAYYLSVTPVVYCAVHVSIKKQLDKKVGMAVQKSIQTRVVGIL